jgi:hypothetical protein
MSFLSANFGWFLLASIVLAVPAGILGIRGFFRSAKKMPSTLIGAMDSFTSNLEESNPTNEDDELGGFMTAGMNAGASMAVDHFKNFFSNMWLPSFLGILSSISLVISAIGFIGWLVQH